MANLCYSRNFYSAVPKLLFSGAKYFNAGGGGYFLFYVEPLKKYSFINSMKRKKMAPTKFSFESEGMTSWSNRTE